MLSRLRRRPLKSVIIQVEIDPHPYPHGEDERRQLYGDTLASITASYFLQRLIFYYHDGEPGMLRHIDIGCFDGKKVSNHDNARRAAITDILRNIKAFFASRGSKCTIVHVLDTDLTYKEHADMWNQKKISDSQKERNEERCMVICPENGIQITCPMCSKKTELVVRGTYPESAWSDEYQPSDEQILAYMSEGEYRDLIKDNPDLAKHTQSGVKTTGSLSICLSKDHGDCLMSNHNVLAVFYTVINHDAKTAKSSYHISRIFSHGEIIENIYGE